jgi:hypothetical protein
MKLRELYTNANTLLNKDSNDGYITMDRFNTLLPSLLFEFVRMKCEELFSITDAGQLIPKSIYSTKFINGILALASISYGDEGNQGAMPTNYLYWLKGFVTIDDGTALSMKEAELITHNEYVDRQTNLLARNISENPVIYMYDNKFKMLPSGTGRVGGYYYIRKPATPFLDYYLDSNYKLQFLDVAATINLTSTSSEYRDGSTTGTKTSATVELEIPEDFHPEFQDLLIEKLSLPLDDQYKNQYAMGKQAKEDAA